LLQRDSAHLAQLPNLVAEIGERLVAAARRSDGFDGGVLSPYWDPVLQHFARLAHAAIARDHLGEC
jgi:hypothetical protein